MKRWWLYSMLLAGLALVLSGCPSEEPSRQPRPPVEPGEVSEEDPLPQLEEKYAELQEALRAQDMNEVKDVGRDCVELASACQELAAAAARQAPEDIRDTLSNADGLARELMLAMANALQAAEASQPARVVADLLEPTQDMLNTLRELFEEAGLTVEQAPAPTP